MAEERLGASFSIDVTDLKAGLTQANRLIRESESEFKAAAGGMDDWSKSEDGLNAKIKSLSNITDIQKKKVSALKTEYQRLVDNGLDPASREAVEFRTKINNEQAALAKNENELKKQTSALQNLGDETKETGSGFEKLKGAGGIAVKAITAVGAACAAAIGAFFGLAESTRETRESMAKLETAFTTAGHTADDATETYKELYSVLGDSGKATEASAHLAQLANNQEDLAKWTNISTGIYATFGDSLPIESLTEAANETAKNGQLTGALSDALVWAGVNEDDFKASLEKCTTEQERQALITETLNGLYREASETYKEVNKDIIESQRVQAELNETLAEFGAISEPILTTLKDLANDVLQSMLPFVELIGEGLTGALNGSSGAADKLAEGLTGIISTLLDKIVSMLPFVIETIVSVVPQLLTALLDQLPLILQTLLVGIGQIANALGSMLPTLIPVIVNAVLLLVETLLDNVDMLVDAGIALLVGLADGLILALPQLIEKIPVIIEKLITAITRNLPTIAKAGIQITLELAKGIVKAIPQLVSKLPQVWKSILTGLRDGLKSVGSIGEELVKGLWNGISDMTGWIKDKIKGFGSSVVNGLKDFFGIHSPSTLMENVVGKNLALGIGKGFEKNIGGVNDMITDAMNFGGSSSNGSSGKNGAGGGRVVNVYQTNNYSQAHSRFEIYKSKQQTAAAVRLAVGV